MLIAAQYTQGSNSEHFPSFRQTVFKEQQRQVKFYETGADTLMHKWLQSLKIGVKSQLTGLCKRNTILSDFLKKSMIFKAKLQKTYFENASFLEYFTLSYLRKALLNNQNTLCVSRFLCYSLSKSLAALKYPRSFSIYHFQIHL